MRSSSFVAVGLAAMLSACAAEQQMMKEDLGPLAQYPGVQQQIKNLYDNNATEDDWTCDMVQMNSITRARTVSETPSTLKVAVTYEFQESDAGGRRSGLQCQGFNTRFFTFSRAGGGLSLESMSGPQRQS